MDPLQTRADVGRALVDRLLSFGINSARLVYKFRLESFVVMTCGAGAGGDDDNDDDEEEEEEEDGGGDGGAGGDLLASFLSGFCCGRQAKRKSQTQALRLKRWGHVSCGDKAPPRGMVSSGALVRASLSGMKNSLSNMTFPWHSQAEPKAETHA